MLLLLTSQRESVGKQKQEKTTSRKRRANSQLASLEMASTNQHTKWPQESHTQQLMDLDQTSVSAKSMRNRKNCKSSVPTAQVQQHLRDPLRRLNMLIRQLLQTFKPSSDKDITSQTRITITSERSNCNAPLGSSTPFTKQELAISKSNQATKQQQQPVVCDHSSARTSVSAFSCPAAANHNALLTSAHIMRNGTGRANSVFHASASNSGCNLTRGRSEPPPTCLNNNISIEEDPSVEPLDSAGKVTRLISLLDENANSERNKRKPNIEEHECSSSSSSFAAPEKLNNVEKQASYEEDNEQAIHLEDSWRSFVRLQYPSVSSSTNSEIQQQQQQPALGSLSLQQEAIWELLSSELFYLNRLRVIICLFQDNLLHLQHHSILTEIDPKSMFSNICQVYEANWTLWNETFQPMLTEARLSSAPLDPSLLRDGFLQIRSTFSPYYRYCLDYSACLIFVKEAYRSNELFKAYLSWCEEQKNCERLHLSDLLAKPMQRLTRYSLLLRTIKKHTEQPDQVRALEQIVAHMNRFVLSVDLELRQRDELEHLAESIACLRPHTVDYPLSAAYLLTSEQLNASPGKLGELAQQLPAARLEQAAQELEQFAKQHSHFQLDEPLFGCQFSCRRQLLLDSRDPSCRLTYGHFRLKDAHTMASTSGAPKSSMMNEEGGMMDDLVLLLFSDQLLICQPTSTTNCRSTTQQVRAPADWCWPQPAGASSGLRRWNPAASSSQSGSPRRWLPGQRAKSSSHSLLVHATPPSPSCPSSPSSGVAARERRCPSSSRLLELPPAQQQQQLQSGCYQRERWWWRPKYEQEVSSGAGNQHLFNAFNEITGSFCGLFGSGSGTPSSSALAPASCEWAAQSGSELPLALSAPRALSLVIAASHGHGLPSSSPTSEDGPTLVQRQQQPKEAPLGSSFPKVGGASQQPSRQNSSSSLRPLHGDAASVKLASWTQLDCWSQRQLSLDGHALCPRAPDTPREQEPATGRPADERSPRAQRRLRCVRAPCPLDHLVVHELKGGLGLLCCQLNGETRTISNSFVILVSGAGGQAASAAHSGEQQKDHYSLAGESSHSDSESGGLMLPAHRFLHQQKMKTNSARRASFLMSGAKGGGDKLGEARKELTETISPASQLKRLILSAQARLRLSARFHQARPPAPELVNMDPSLVEQIERILEGAFEPVASSSREGEAASAPLVEPWWLRPNPQLSSHSAEPIGRALLDQYQLLLLTHNLLFDFPKQPQQWTAFDSQNCTPNTWPAPELLNTLQPEQQEEATAASSERQLSLLLSPLHYSGSSSVNKAKAAVQRAHFSRSARARDFSTDHFSSWPAKPAAAAAATSSSSCISLAATSCPRSHWRLKQLPNAASYTSTEESLTAGPDSFERQASEDCPASSASFSARSCPAPTMQATRQAASQQLILASNSSGLRATLSVSTASCSAAPRRHLSSLRRQNVITSASSDNQQQQNHLLSVNSTRSSGHHSGGTVTGADRHRLFARLQASSGGSQATSMNTSAAFGDSIDQQQQQQQQQFYLLETDCSAVLAEQELLSGAIASSSCQRASSFELSSRAAQQRARIDGHSPTCTGMNPRSASMETRAPISVTLTLPASSEPEQLVREGQQLQQPSSNLANELELYLSVPAAPGAAGKDEPQQPVATMLSATRELLSPDLSVSVTSQASSRVISTNQAMPSTCSSTSTSSSQAPGVVGLSCLPSSQSSASAATRASPVLVRLKRLFKRTNAPKVSEKTRKSSNLLNVSPEYSSILFSGKLSHRKRSSASNCLRQSSSSLELTPHHSSCSVACIQSIPDREQSYRVKTPLSEPLSSVSSRRKDPDERLVLADVSSIRSLIKVTTTSEAKIEDSKHKSELNLNLQSDNSGYLGFHEKLLLHQQLQQAAGTSKDPLDYPLSYQNDGLSRTVNVNKPSGKGKISRWSRTNLTKQQKRPLVKSMHSLLRAASLRSNRSSKTTE